jgi:hypothetical protein
MSETQSIAFKAIIQTTTGTAVDRQKTPSKEAK